MTGKMGVHDWWAKEWVRTDVGAVEGCVASQKLGRHCQLATVAPRLQIESRSQNCIKSLQV
jgi:hypothetical protein